MEGRGAQQNEPDEEGGREDWEEWKAENERTTDLGDKVRSVSRRTKCPA